jgi:hypothetical protein
MAYFTMAPQFFELDRDGLVIWDGHADRCPDDVYACSPGCYQQLMNMPLSELLVWRAA